MTPAETVRAVYEILSGRADEARDWDRFRALHHPQARIVPVSALVEFFDVEGYIKSRTPMLTKNDFYERERSSSERIWGRVAHVLSEYDSRRTLDGEAFAQGVNSYQFVNEGGVWLITSVTWSVTGT